MINKKWRNSTLNREAYSSFIAVGSDHRIATAKIRLSLRMHKNASKNRVNYDWMKLIADNDVKSSNTIEVQNRFEALQAVDDSNTANSIYNDVMEVHEKSAELHIPRKKKVKHHVPWENEDIAAKRKALNVAFKAKSERGTRSNTARFDKAKTDLDAAYKNEIYGRKNTSRGKLKANSPHERITKWKEHFSNLLGKPPVTNGRPIINVIGNTLPINIGDFSRKELVEYMNTFANGKKAGLDNIPVEAWKTLIEPLLDVCNKTLHGDKADVSSGLVPLPKEGNLGYADQYRGISLSVIAAKIYNKMLLFRIRPHIEPILRNNQNGYCPKRSTVGQILTLRRLIEGIKSKNLSAVLTFVDFSKAFDSIHWGKLMQILQAYGIPDSIVSAINILYEDTMAQVLSPDGDTEFFKIFLFIVALDYAMRIAASIPPEAGFTLAPCHSKRHQAIIIIDTDFADDIALISDNLEKAQLLLLRVEIAADIIGLHVNEKKTEFMIINDVEGDLLILQGNALERVDDRGLTTLSVT